MVALTRSLWNGRFDKVVPTWLLWQVALRSLSYSSTKHSTNSIWPTLTTYSTVDLATLVVTNWIWEKSSPQGPTTSISSTVAGLRIPNPEPTWTAIRREMYCPTHNRNYWSPECSSIPTPIYRRSSPQIPLISSYRQFHDAILLAMKYLNYEASIMFTLRSGRWLLPMEHRWRNVAGLLREHRSQLFLPIWGTSQWTLYCAVLRCTCVVGSAEQDPSVVVGERFHSVVQLRGFWATI